MKRELLETHIGKQVRIVLFDDTILRGTLKSGNAFFPSPKWYHVPEVHMTFRSSHVKKCEATK